MEPKVQIIKNLQAYLQECISEKRYIMSSGMFSRQATLAYKEVALFLLSLPKLSLAISLDIFLENHFGSKAPIMSKSSMSKARYKLSHKLFMDWNQQLCADTYNYMPQKTWKGHLLYGIDGSTGSIPDCAATRRVFGLRTNQHGQGTLARFLVCYDVLNHYCVRSAVVAYTTSERAVAYKWAQRLDPSGIYIYDRGFASFTHFWLLNRYNKSFVIRCKLGFNKEVKAFVEGDLQSSVIELSANHKAQKQLREMGINVSKSTSVTVRLVKVKLDDGSMEVLVTNLLDSNKYPNDCFKELYFKRWGVEVFFDKFKNQMDVEVFSGRKPEAIKQEFYASVFIYNLQSLLIADCEAALENKNVGKTQPHQINRNVSFGLIKVKILQIFLLPDVSQVLENLQRKFLKNTLPIVPNRHNPRDKSKKRQRDRFRQNTNFARAS